MISSFRTIFKKDNLLVESLDGVTITTSLENSLWTFKLEFHQDIELSEVYLEFEFSSPVKFCRSSAYRWVEPVGLDWVANSHSPKILQCQNGYKVVAQSVQGCWEYSIQEKKLKWYLIHPELTPVMVYDQEDRRVFLQNQIVRKGTTFVDGVLWTKGDVEEWARTPLGFVPIVCFTDHCDFDTHENLPIQRKFLGELGIRVTKGFFLYNYTHKSENANFEEEDTQSELIQWESEGHQLAYHALSQSYRGQQSEEEFRSFMSPPELKPITTYIDHGFHPYNFTKQPLGNWESWYSHMEKKGVQLIWSYVDSGEGNLFSVNQLNPQGFTLHHILKSAQEAKKTGILRNRKTLLRDLLMFGVPEEIFWASKYFKGSLYGLKKGFTWKGITSVFVIGVQMLKTIFTSGIFSNIKNRIHQVFPTARFAPLFFKAPNQKDSQIWIFQTLFVRDFEVVFSKPALEKLLEDKGVMIAHTYFAYANPGHEGRFFEDQSWKIRPQTEKAFARLSEKIRNQEIWNPTLQEMKDFYDQINGLKYSPEGDKIVIRNFNGITKTIV